MRRWLLSLLAAILVAPALADTVVRVERGDLGSLPAELATLRSLDYGSYQWLRVDQDGLSQLRRSGSRYQIVADADLISFGRHRFDPLERSAAGLAPMTRAGESFHLVQWFGPPGKAELDSLRRAGLEPLQYYPGNAYLVWGGQQQAAGFGARAEVRWLGAFAEEFKPSADLDKRSGVIENVAVQFYNLGDPAATIDALRNAGAQVLRWHAAQPDKRFYEAIVIVDAARTDAFARIPEVLWYGYQSPRGVLEDEMSSQIVGGNTVGGVPQLGYLGFLSGLGLDGTGVTWAVTDSGVDLSHPEFAGRIADGFSYPGCLAGNGPGDDSGSGGHGTHVAGIIGGAGVLGLVDGDGFNYAIGVAPAAQIFAQNPICNSSVPWPPAGGWQELSKRALAGGAVGTNASWTTGEGSNHGYQNSERTFDFIVRDGDFDTAGIAEQFYFVFSAGNSGPGASTLTAPKEAKNSIVVGASNNQRAGSIESIASFSSRGPSVDGRTFPTISAPGAQIASTRRVAGASQCATAIAGTSNQMSFCSGTSMAAPHVSGLGALLVQWWRGNNGGAEPSPAMLKALMVNGARDMQNVAAIPNNTEGWGRVHIPGSLADGVSRHYIDQTEVLDDTGEVFELQVRVVDNGEPLRITLAWSDAPGAIGANPALVNDLDLEVDVDGATYLGNDFASGASTTGGSADRRNNLENVFVPSAGGAVTIRVRANVIAGDGVPFSGDDSDQDFALVCTNCEQGPGYSMNLAQTVQAVCAPADAVFPVTIGTILGYTDPVSLSLSGEPAGTTVDFSDNPVNPPGSSTLTIGNTGAASAGSYVLQLDASSTAGPQSRTLDLMLDTAIPLTPVLSMPADAATDQPVQPTFSWSAPAQSGSFLIEIATDAGFSDIVDSATVSVPEYTAAVLLNTSSTYYWRVLASNSCGDSSASLPFSFTTIAAPGDCGIGSQPAVSYSDDFETGAADWSSSGTNNSWMLSMAQSNSGVTSWHANDPTNVSDQRLLSPSLVLPSGQAPLTLQFFHRRDIEDNNGSACWDAGILEFSTDGGSNWTQVADGDLLTDPYTGNVSGTTNPLAGQPGWCDVQDWTRSVVDIDALAGQTAQFRFRLGSDGSVGGDGWYVDDFKIQSCTDSNLIFDDGFEQ